MFSVGALVKFNWWSSYRAASATTDDTGHVTWHEIYPGDKGVVLCVGENDMTIVLFSNVDTLLRIHCSMLEAI
jgi:hypothetical protein